MGIYLENQVCRAPLITRALKQESQAILSGDLIDAEA